MMNISVFRRNATSVSVLSMVFLAFCALCSACSDGLSFWTEEASGNPISIGGIDTDAMTVSSISSRSTGSPAESIDWLLQPLKQGIDITYGLYNKANKCENVAILKLEDSHPETVETPDYDVQNGLSVYTFRYRSMPTGLPSGLVINTNKDAIWYDNGPHYFQGVHVPERIRYTNNIDEIEKGDGKTGPKAASLTTDQHIDVSSLDNDNALGNYTLLSHYLGMPANFKLTATIERIKLPFRHRLARVIAFVLIDRELGTTLKGYQKDAQGKDDPTTTSFRFCNVKVLQGVKDVEGADGHHILTPTWYEARKVIPHFEGEKGSYSYKTNQELDTYFKYYYKVDDNGRMEQLFPTSTNWQAVHDATADSQGRHNGYTEVDYGKVPVYDIIVQPTYTTADSVMYDEENYATSLTTLAAQTNKIDFEIELENGLRYEKRFEFDLNANYQTVVYLRIAREHVDYNDAGSALWIEDKNYDGWYGVDNENGNILSFAGSSWQRAYTYYDSTNPFFKESLTNTNSNLTDGDGANGITDGKFYDATTQADETVEHAQYFSSTYQAEWIKRFLQAYEGGDHHGDYFILQDDITIDARLIPDNFVFTGHLDGQDHTIRLEHAGETVTDKEARDEDHYEAATDGDYGSTLYVLSGENYVPYTIMTLLYTKDSDGNYSEAHPTIAELMNGTTYYSDTEGTVYPKPTLYANHPIHHDAITHQSPAFLFAGLNGTYTTAQENAPDPYAPGVNWEANVHQETNGSGTHWVPTLGYRAEVINVRVANSASLFKEGATASGSNPDITGNVQNCWSKWTGNKQTATRVEHTPAIPQYK